MAWKVWIDPDLCTGDGLCEEIEPKVFYGHDDGLYYVKEVDWTTGLDSSGNPRYVGATGLASVPDELLANVIEAADECPGECIFIEEV